jgi:hypothetical protein
MLDAFEHGADVLRGFETYNTGDATHWCFVF